MQIGQLLVHYVKKWFLGRTPRQAYSVTFMMPKVRRPSLACGRPCADVRCRAQADFGLVLPRISLLATIALAYSVLSPIINGLAMLSFLLFFVSWKFRACAFLLGVRARPDAAGSLDVGV